MFWQKKRMILFVMLAAFLAGVMFTGGCYVTKDFLSAKKGPAGPGSANAEVLPGVGADTIADVVSAASPAVVKISTRTTSYLSDPFFNDPFFRQFFGLPSRPRVQEGLGSGFIISSDGYILTNEHVIDGAEEIGVTVVGLERELKATVVGADYDLDLALLKVDAGRELPYLTLGNSDQVRVGNWVIAIGNPYGLDHTVTTGVISAKGRPITVGDRHYENLLQTDASINPGNSGGPLLNLSGEVIGINTAINAQAQGIGFAIPTSTVQRVLEDLRSGSSGARPWIGVQVRAVDQEVARYLGLARAEGALVVGVVAGSPADWAGLRQGDVIVEFNGTRVTNPDELIAAIKSCQVGSSVKLIIIRNRQEIALKVAIGNKPRNIG